MRETSPAAWYLEGFADDGREVWRTAIRRLPFTIGRRMDCDLVLQAPRVSLRHADFRQDRSTLWLRDRGSTNGTFLNGERLTSEHAVHDGDVIHFADREFRLVASGRKPSTLTTQTMTLRDSDPERQIFERQRQLRQLLDDDGLQTSFQPLVRLANGEIVGYEVLGRAFVGSEEIPPLELFDVAATLHLESRLSAAFRAKGLEQARALAGDPMLFVKTHPAELDRPDELLASLERLRGLDPRRRLILEIHEQGTSDLSALKALRTDLESLQVDIAFDGFGTGQSRLLELIEVAPRFVKFDRTWIRALHLASKRRREMMDTLVALVTEWKVATIAEGVEGDAEAAACAELGFGIGQGHYFGHPAPASELAGRSGMLPETG